MELNLNKELLIFFILISLIFYINYGKINLKKGENK